MAIGVDFKTLVDVRAIGSEQIVADYSDIPFDIGGGMYTFRTNELPLDVPFPASTDALSVRVVNPVTHVYSGGAVFTAVYAPTLPLSGQYQIDPVLTFKFGTIKFNKLDGAQTVEVRCTGRGSLVFASDVNDPRDEIKDGRSSEISLGERMDRVEDGTRILSTKILPRHISTTLTDNFIFPNNLTVNGSLNVLGTLTYVHSTVVQIGDSILQLNFGAVGAPTVDGGLTIMRGSSPSAEMLWRETTDSWEMTQGGLKIAGNINLSYSRILNAGPQIVGSQIDEDALVGTAFTGQMIFRYDLDTPRYYSSLASAFISPGVKVTRHDYVVGTPDLPYTGSTTAFDLPFNYVIGSHELMVYVDGLLFTSGSTKDYVETSVNLVTFNSPLTAGSNVAIVNVGRPV